MHMCKTKFLDKDVEIVFDATIMAFTRCELKVKKRIMQTLLMTY